MSRVIFELAKKIPALTTYAAARAILAEGKERSEWAARSQQKYLVEIADQQIRTTKIRKTQRDPVKSKTKRHYRATRMIERGELTEEQEQALACAYDFKDAWPEWFDPDAGADGNLIRRDNALAFSYRLLKNLPASTAITKVWFHPEQSDWNLFGARLGLCDAPSGSRAIIGELHFGQRDVEGEEASFKITRCQFVIHSELEKIEQGSLYKRASKSDPVVVQISNDDGKVAAWSISDAKGLDGPVEASKEPWCLVKPDEGVIEARVRARPRDITVILHEQSGGAHDENLQERIRKTVKNAYFARFPRDQEQRTMVVLGTYRHTRP